ncbi:hypothetical protein I350_06185 [Cryptococcus amylolentus CBS 6273]|uniref:Peroxisomal ATPase PEX1 n=1 Tax=Cryptococcus amylolentus CBS 6273 TaxID=1296118 RepID=A0A1E3JL32_9TREE|nr:hypothetical protein I350_06185 [Cryptococcus amylolentus CBS 6273]
MARKAAVKYRSLRSNLVNLPLSLYAQLGQQQARPQGLILHLSPLSVPSSSSSRNPKAAYLGWSGLNAAVSPSQLGDGLESVEVDPEVAMSYGWSEGAILEISVIHNPTVARSVAVTPLTSDDWEILEQHASFLEDNLLSQLRAAVKGQEIDVWVMGRTKIRIRVDDTDPGASNTAVLIKADTEIHVAPRPRTSQLTSAASSILPQPALRKSSLPNGAAKSEGSGRPFYLRLVPPSVAGSWGHFIPAPQVLADSGYGRLAVCSPFTISQVCQTLSLPPDHQALHVVIRLHELAPETPPGPISVEEEAKPKKEVTVVLTSWEEMPDGFVAFAGNVADWMEGWGEVLVSGAEGKIKKTKAGKGGHIPSISFPKETTQRNIGFDKITETSLGYLQRSSISGLSKPLLLLGAKGSGKTRLVKTLAELLAKDISIVARPVYVDVGRLDPEERIASIRENMDKWLEDASASAPSCLVLDDLDSLIAPETELQTSSNSPILADYFTRLFSPSSIPPGVLVIVTALDASTLHPLLNTRHIFGETVKVPALTKEVREEVLRGLVEESQRTADGLVNGVEGGGEEEEEMDYVVLGGMTEGYAMSDLNDLLVGAIQQAVIRTTKSGETNQVNLTMTDFRLAKEEFTPVGLRGVKMQGSEVEWKDIGGLEEPRRILRSTLEHPTKYAPIFAQSPLRLPSGLLLYGYPGCGKTLLASAVAKECGLNFVAVKGPEVLNKYIGASEKGVRDLFERAQGARPCVLFFDEFDSVAPKRGHDSTGVTDRVVNQLLTEMDGAQGLSGVYVLAATSRPDLLDPALLRPGRLDKAILCDMPSPSDRLGILEAVVKKGGVELGVEVDLEEIVRRTDGFSGADLQAVIYNAHLEVVHGSFEQDVEKGEKDKTLVNGTGHTEEDKGDFKLVMPKDGGKLGSVAARAELKARMETIVSNARGLGQANDENKPKESKKPVIRQHHLLKSLSETRPSVSSADKRRLELIYNGFINGRDGKMSDGDAGHDTGTRVSLM